MKRLLHFGYEQLIPVKIRQAITSFVIVVMYVQRHSGVTISPVVEELLVHNCIRIDMA